MRPAHGVVPTVHDLFDVGDSENRLVLVLAACHCVAPYIPAEVVLRDETSWCFRRADDGCCQNCNAASHGAQFAALEMKLIH
jgi:hypothetical protein